MGAVYITRRVCSLERTEFFKRIDRLCTILSLITLSVSLSYKFLYNRNLDLGYENIAIAIVSLLVLSHKKILRVTHWFYDPLRSLSLSVVGMMSNLLPVHTHNLYHGVFQLGYKFRYINPSDLENDLKVLTDLGNEAFKGYSKYSYKDRKSFYRRWYERNNEVFVLIYREHEPVGYFCLLPMNSGGDNPHFKGLESQFTINEQYISASEDKTDLIYVQAVYLKVEYSNSFQLSKAAYSVFCSILNRFSSGSRGLTIYAEQLSPIGEGLLRKLGFYTDRVSADEYPIYELHFNGERGKYAEKDKNYAAYRKFKKDVLDAFIT